MEDCNHHNIMKFVEAVENCGLLDLHIVGPRFTWCRQVGGRTVMRCKLDRTGLENSLEQQRSRCGRGH